MARVAYDYPYRLKIEHADFAELRLSRRGRPIVFDPAVPPSTDDLVILTGPGPDRLRATADAVRAGVRPTVLAAPEIAAWLRGLGPVEAVPPTATQLDDLGVRWLDYTPLPREARPFRPVAALRALRERTSWPEASPRVWQLTFPDGARLLHLDLALHRGASPAWLEDAVAAFANPEWILVGCAYGEGAAVQAALPRFGGRRVLVVEINNAERRALGLPIELVTPLRDKLVDVGVEAHVFATQASYRFE